MVNQHIYKRKYQQTGQKQKKTQSGKITANNIFHILYMN